MWSSRLLLFLSIYMYKFWIFFAVSLHLKYFSSLVISYFFCLCFGFFLNSPASFYACVCACAWMNLLIQFDQIRSESILQFIRGCASKIWPNHNCLCVCVLGCFVFWTNLRFIIKYVTLMANMQQF